MFIVFVMFNSREISVTFFFATVAVLVMLDIVKINIVGYMSRNTSHSDTNRGLGSSLCQKGGILNNMFI